MWPHSLGTWFCDMLTVSSSPIKVQIGETKIVFRVTHNPGNSPPNQEYLRFCQSSWILSSMKMYVNR